jgi:predicted GH43/DUF377 family glycosyl hydrolase
LFKHNNIYIQKVSDYKNINLSKMNGSVLIYSGNSSDWDEHIREIGNIVYNPKTEEYLFFYPAYNGEYKQNNVFVGMAYSKDGLNWQKYGKVLNLSAEDPYVILYNNTFYMFFEDKDEVPFRRISLATSQDAINWTVIKRGIINPSLIGWQSQDVSSPLVLQVDGGWVLIYEGRGSLKRGSLNQGKFGYAFSSDLINWKKKIFPIFSGGSYWDHHVVQDDIVQYGGNYIMTYHGYSKKYGWQSGLAVSKDLKKWETLTKDPISESDTVMFYSINSSKGFLEEFDNKVNLKLI